jgi:uncharacterized protein (TIGR03437 family)
MKLRLRLLFLNLILFPFFCHAASGLVYSNLLPALGSIGSTFVAAMVVDPAGNSYLTGSTENPAFPVTPGAFQTKFGSGTCTAGGPQPQTFICPDAFVMKLDTKGNVVFATYLGGSGYDQATSIAVDGDGNISVAGITTSNNFPTVAGSTFGGTGPTFIVKLDSSGRMLFTAQIPGTGDLPFVMPNGSNLPVSETNLVMTVDFAGNIYFASHGTTGFPVTSGALQTSGPMVVGKLNPSLSKLLYATYLGGSGTDSIRGIAIDKAGDVFLTGTTSSTNFPVTAGALQTTLQGASTSFVAKLDPTGTKLIYATYLRGPFASASEIRVDVPGNAYVLGTAQSPGFPVTPNAFDTTYTPGSAFLSKINSDGTALVYSTFVPTITGIPVRIMDVDAAGNAYVAGTTGPGFPVSDDALQSCSGGAAGDIFVARFASDGSLGAATYFGQGNPDTALALAAAGDGSVVLAGVEVSPDVRVAPIYFIDRFFISDPANAGMPCLTPLLYNSASLLSGPIAPGELVTLHGLHLGPDAAASGSITTGLGGVHVFFDELEAPLLYAQSTQLNVQAPWELIDRTVTQIRVDYNGFSTKIRDAPMQPAAPALFRSATQGIILNSDGALNSPSNPAQRGDFAAIFGTGGGPTSPAGVTGGITPLTPVADLLFLTLPVSVQMDGMDAQVLYAGAAPTLSSGVFQINFVIPASVSSGGPHFIDVKIGDQASSAQSRAAIAIQ